VVAHLDAHRLAVAALARRGRGRCRRVIRHWCRVIRHCLRLSFVFR
jgi:hypothetical protein